MGEFYQKFTLMTTFPTLNPILFRLPQLLQFKPLVIPLLTQITRFGFRIFRGKHLLIRTANIVKGPVQIFQFHFFFGS